MVPNRDRIVTPGTIAAGSGSRIALGQVLGLDRSAAGSGSKIAPGQAQGRDRILLGQDRSGIRLQDRSGTGSGA